MYRWACNAKYILSGSREATWLGPAGVRHVLISRMALADKWSGGWHVQQRQPRGLCASLHHRIPWQQEQ